MAEDAVAVTRCSRDGPGTVAWRWASFIATYLPGAVHERYAKGLSKVRAAVASIPAESRLRFFACKLSASAVYTTLDFVYLVPPLRVASALGRNLLWIPGTGVLTGAAVFALRFLWLPKAIRERKLTAWVGWTVTGAVVSYYATSYNITDTCIRAGALSTWLPVQTPDTLLDDAKEEMVEVAEDTHRIASIARSIAAPDSILNPFSGLGKLTKLMDAVVQFKENREEFGDNSEYDCLGRWGKFYNTIEVQTHVAAIYPRALLRASGYWDKTVAEFLLYVGFDADTVTLAVFAPARAPLAVKSSARNKNASLSGPPGELEDGQSYDIVEPYSPPQTSRVLREIGLTSVEVATEARLDSTAAGIVVRTVWAVASESVALLLDAKIEKKQTG